HRSRRESPVGNLAAAAGGGSVERRLALALALSLAILVGFQVLFPHRPPERVPSDVVATTAAHTQPAAIPATEAAPEPDPGTADPGATVDVSSRLFRARFASRGGRLISFELSEYRKDPAPGDGPYDLVNSVSPAPLALMWRNEAGEVVDDRSVVYEITKTGDSALDDKPVVITMRGRTQAGGTITKTIEIPPNSYLLDYKV